MSFMTKAGSPVIQYITFALEYASGFPKQMQIENLLLNKKLFSSLKVQPFDYEYLN